jgi:hypothetical protein
MTSYDSGMAAEPSDRIWNYDGSSVEIRTEGKLLDGRPALDEIVCTGATVHLEQRDANQWWMEIQAGGRDFHIWFTMEDGRLCVRLTDQQDEVQWEGDNRPKALPGDNGQ